MKNQDGGEIWHIRLGFETVSWQLVAHIQKRFYSIHAEPFSRTPKSSKQKKGSASRVLDQLPFPELFHPPAHFHLKFNDESGINVPFFCRPGIFSSAFLSKTKKQKKKTKKIKTKHGPLKWLKILQVDSGREFMSAFQKLMENYKTFIRRGRNEFYRDQAINEYFNRSLGERLSIWSLKTTKATVTRTPQNKNIIG